MSAAKELKTLLFYTRALIVLLMITGFFIDGFQGNDPLFITATLLWVYQPFVVRAESYLLHYRHPSFRCSACKLVNLKKLANQYHVVSRQRHCGYAQRFPKLISVNHLPSLGV